MTTRCKLPFMLAAAAGLGLAIAEHDAVSAAAAGACPAPPDQPLAFWFGHWDVYAQEKLDGRNFVESTLGGCAVIEHWDDASGFKGMSVFYFEPHAHQWKQVWITDHAFAPGGLKEKTMIFSSADSVRFQGAIWVAPDRMVLDRTTLRKLDRGRVSQTIEYSKDGGTTWTASYDAIYRPAAAPAAGRPAN
ncbi:MAG TPA: hypothetical protein VGH81_00905 [Rudaea sp.]